MDNDVGVVYDVRMTKHMHPTQRNHVECPDRITVPYQMLKEKGLLERCTIVPPRLATEAELRTVHTEDYIQCVKSYKSINADSNVCNLPERWPTYISDLSYESATCAAGCVINMVDAVMSQQVSKGVALVRPPGHHAEVDESCGFCFFNNVAIAAKHAQQTYGAERVLILDWDIHHGNGIQHVFYDDPSVLYMSLHRFDNGDYFPNLKDSSHLAVGSGAGEGYNVNIPWNKDQMGNAEYKLAFDRIILPIANQYKPDLIIIASGFDAAAADPLGEYILSPDMYAYMTSKLSHLAQGHIILVLEGGYNPRAIGESLSACMNVLLRDNKIVLKNLGEPCKRALQTISAVIACQSNYWKIK